MTLLDNVFFAFVVGPPHLKMVRSLLGSGREVPVMGDVIIFNGFLIIEVNLNFALKFLVKFIFVILEQI